MRRSTLLPPAAIGMQARSRPNFVDLAGLVMLAAALLVSTRAEPPPDVPNDRTSVTIATCTAGSFQQLARCQELVATGERQIISIEGTVQCDQMASLQPVQRAAGCLDVHQESHASTRVLWITGAESAGTGGLYRTNYSSPLLAINQNRGEVAITRLTLEDAPWPSCFPRLAPSYATQAMVNVHGAAGVTFRNVTFLRGFKIAVSLVQSRRIVFSDSLWLESNTFGIWADPDQRAAYSRDVHFFGNRFLRGQNNAFIGTLSGSIFQGNEFVHNHHIACFNQSGGQLDILQSAGPNHDLTLATNRVVGGSITGGDSGQDWRRLSTYLLRDSTSSFLWRIDQLNCLSVRLSQFICICYVAGMPSKSIPVCTRFCCRTMRSTTRGGAYSPTTGPIHCRRCLRLGVQT